MTWRRFAPGGAVAEVALTLAASAAGMLVYQGFFATLGYLSGLGLACLVGGVTAALGHRRTWSTALLTVAGPALVIVFVVFRGAVSAVPDGLRGSWNRLLTVAVPADPWGELLVVPALVLWAAAFSSVLLVLRTRHLLAPLVPPLAGFLFAVFAVGNQAGGHTIATAVFLLAALSLVGVRAYRATGTETIQIGRRSSRPITALAAVALVVAASALFGVVGGHALPLASGEHRFDPRDLVSPPVTSTDTLTPLSQLKSQLTEVPPRMLFTVRIQSGPAELVDRVRTAALDDFDGTTWTAANTYRVAGSHLTADPAQTLGKPVTARIEVMEVPGPHLPVIGWPSRLSAAGAVEERFGFDSGSGVVVRTKPEPGLGYDVTGEVTGRDAGLSQAGTTSSRLPALSPGLPEPLRAWAGTFRQSNPYDRLVALEASFRSHSYQLDRPPGHSYAVITRLLAGQPKENGYAEQYAAAFAVLARAWGLPARVAVGYRLRNDQGGFYRVSTADAHAWPEVHFTGYGWVVFEPTKAFNGYVPIPPADAPRVVPPRPDPSTTVPMAAPPGTSLPTETPDEQGFGWNGVLRGSSLLVPVAVVLVLLAGGSVAIAKALRRRRRRRRPGHAAKVLGAWQELIDRLVERGVSPPVSLTFHEVAEYARGHVGIAASPIEAAAELATTAVYAPEHLDDADAERAWRLAEQLRTGLHPRRASAARLRAAADPRPLWTVWSRTRQRRQARESLEMGRYR